MDSHAKGRAAERDVMDSWTARGWDCWQPPRAKWRKGNDGGQDIFGVGDFIAVKLGEPAPVRLVQVTCAKSYARHRRAVDAWNEVYGDILPCYLIAYPDDKKRVKSHAKGG